PPAPRLRRPALDDDVVVPARPLRVARHAGLRPGARPLARGRAPGRDRGGARADPAVLAGGGRGLRGSDDRRPQRLRYPEVAGAPRPPVTACSCAGRKTAARAPRSARRCRTWTARSPSSRTRTWNTTPPRCLR